jgi:hypothetical protein
MSPFSNNQLHKTCPSDGHEIRRLSRKPTRLLQWSKEYATSPNLTDTWIYSSFFQIKFSEGRKIRISHYFQFFPASCCLQSKFEYSHHHSGIHRLHLNYFLNVKLEDLNRTVSSISWIKSSFSFINATCIGSYFSPIGLLQLWHIQTFNYRFVMIFMILPTTLSKWH